MRRSLAHRPLEHMPQLREFPLPADHRYVRTTSDRRSVRVDADYAPGPVDVCAGCTRSESFRLDGASNEPLRTASDYDVAGAGHLPEADSRFNRFVGGERRVSNVLACQNLAGVHACVRGELEPPLSTE